MNIDFPPFRAPDTLSPSQRLYILDGHVTDAIADGRVCAIAQAIRDRVLARACVSAHCDLSSEGLQMQIAQALLDYVQSLGYRSDPPGQEWYQGVWWTILHGGDCEDLSVAFVSLARCAGLDAALFWITQKGASLNHVSAMVTIGGKRLSATWVVGGRYFWAEGTVNGAKIGENPLQAAQRAGQSSHLGLQ